MHALLPRVQVLLRCEPWPRLQRLSVSCPFVHATIGGDVLVRCFPALRSLDWPQLMGAQQVGIAAGMGIGCRAGWRGALEMAPRFKNVEPLNGIA